VVDWDRIFPGWRLSRKKDIETYREILRRHGMLPEHFVMVGNSVKSDILPVVALGASAVHIPYRVSPPRDS
jgi:putative hydrolase of the HAD superfamily